MGVRTRVARSSVVLGLLAVFALGVTQPAPAAAQEEETLYAPWTLIAVSQGGPVEEVFDNAATDAVFAWNTTRGAFDTWRRGLPAGLNTLPRIADGQAVWVLSSQPHSITQAPFAGAQQIALVGGWTMVGWTGATTPAAAVAEILGAAIVFAYDGPTQAFQRYDANGLAILNSLAQVEQGAGLWVFRAAAGAATIPAAVPLIPDPAAATTGLAVSLPDRWASQATPDVYIAAETAGDLDAAQAPLGTRLIAERVPNAPLDPAAVAADFFAALDP
ncbi:MAG: hypothetical protein DK306_001704 [Chloroflexi bacterium]|nr:MAG: hypothetical protein DK306_001704 [Chloroflexota bacterium]